MSEHKTPLTIITESLPGYTLGEPYEISIEASGGTEPYVFELSQGAFPAGLGLSESGTIEGTPESAEGDVTIFVKVTDADGDHLTQAFDLQEAES